MLVLPKIWVRAVVAYRLDVALSLNAKSWRAEYKRSCGADEFEFRLVVCHDATVPFHRRSDDWRMLFLPEVRVRAIQRAFSVALRRDTDMGRAEYKRSCGADEFEFRLVVCHDATVPFHGRIDGN